MGKKQLKLLDKTQEKVVSMDVVFSRYARNRKPRIPTNIIVIDALLNGGMLPGDYIELCSDSGLGKSTIALQIAKYFARKVGWVLILDFEQGMTDELIDSMSLAGLIEEGKIVVLQPITYGDADEIMESIIDDPPSLVLIDSITSMNLDYKSKKKKKNKNDEKTGMGVGAKSRKETEFLLRYKGWARKNDVIFIMINQLRVKFTKQFFAYLDSSGSNALRYYSDARIFMTKTEDLYRKEETLNGIQNVIYGNTLKIMTKKSRAQRSFIGLECDLVYGKGISNIKTIANLLGSVDMIVRGGSYYTINVPGCPETKVQGVNAVLLYVKEHIKTIKQVIQDNRLLKLTNGEEVK